MNMQYQDLDATREKINKMYTKNPKRSISGTYRTLRSQQRISLIGDYPIISTIISEVVKLGITPSRYQLTHALNQSSELKFLPKNIKSDLLNQLLYISHDQLKRHKKAISNTLTQKTNNIVS